MSDCNPPARSEAASILVVDDDPMLLRMTQIVLLDLGYGVTPAADGREALRKIEEAGGGFDLVILDMRMPDMDGMTVLENVHIHWPTLKVLLVTGYASDGVLQATRDFGAVGILEKPYDPDTLGARVRQVLAQS